MNTLLQLNVNEHVEKKNGLSYLSWAWAWAEALKHDPEATWVVHTYAGGEEPFMRVGKSAMVHVSVTLRGIRRECMLPVMDHRNKAIQEPDAFQVNTAIMRCMTKALSMHGLGLYIYAGEDLPEGTPESPLGGLDPNTDEVVGYDSLVPALKASIEAVKKPGVHSPNHGAGDGMSEERKRAMEEVALEIIDAFHADKAGTSIRIWYDNTHFNDNDERAYAWSLMKTESKLRALIKANQPKREEATT